MREGGGVGGVEESGGRNMETIVLEQQLKKKKEIPKVLWKYK